MSAIQSRQPHELLDGSRLDEYFALRDAVGKLLTELRTALFILRRTRAFPFDLLGLRVFKQHIWTALEASLLESVILRIRMLVLDPTSDSLWSLRALVAEAIKPELQNDLCEQLVNVNFSPEVVEILGRINKLRNKVIAHFDLAFQSRIESVKLRSFDELSTVEKALVAQFELLCFGFGQATLPSGYLDTEAGLGAPRETDIEALLKLVASNSDLLNFPETRAEYWNATKDEPAFQETRALVNEWRVRLGLAPK